MNLKKQDEKTSESTPKRRPTPTNLGKIFRALRNERDMNMGDMADKLGCSKSYLSQVETGKIPPSIELLQKYIKVFEVDAPKAYNLYIIAYENFDRITIDMKDLRILNREYFSRLLAIIKFFEPHISPYNTEVYNLQNAIDAIWKLSMP
jgi:transcriptional regulator with XRE-family HTH domain